MNVAMLSTLVAIIDRGSFAAAARDVGCTPSAVSLQVKQLEAYFGQLLFDRSTRTAKPTPFAREAVAVARDFSTRLEALRARPSMTVSGRVRLGAIASVQTGALPLALRLLRDRHPALHRVAACWIRRRANSATSASPAPSHTRERAAFGSGTGTDAGGYPAAIGSGCPKPLASIARSCVSVEAGASIFR